MAEFDFNFLIQSHPHQPLWHTKDISFGQDKTDDRSESIVFKSVLNKEKPLQLNFSDSSFCTDNYMTSHLQHK